MNQKGFVNIAITIGIVIMAGIAGYFVLNQRTMPSPVPTPTPTPSTSATPTQTPTNDSGSNTMTVSLGSLGEEFTLKKGETARVKGLNVFLKVKDFIYSPCPKGSQCIWSGLAVVYELVVDGKVYDAPSGNLPPEAPYNVLVKNTDYKTYADFVIEKPETPAKERACIGSGGTVTTSSCCKSVSSFPNTCLVGACGCSPTNSHNVYSCRCSTGKCFGGTGCVEFAAPSI